jgi:hypothetical protein
MQGLRLPPCLICIPDGLHSVVVICFLNWSSTLRGLLRNFDRRTQYGSLRFILCSLCVSHALCASFRSCLDVGFPVSLDRWSLNNLNYLPAILTLPTSSFDSSSVQTQTARRGSFPSPPTSRLHSGVVRSSGYWVNVSHHHDCGWLR